MTVIRPASPVRSLPAAPRATAAPAPRPAAPAVAAQVDAKGLGDLLRQGLQKFQWAVRWLINGPTVDAWKTREVLDDPDTRWASRTELLKAQADVAARLPQEEAALAKLGGRSELYRALADACARDPMARVALQNMLLDGRLAGQKDLAGKGDMLDHLGRLTTQPLAAGLDRADLLTNLIEELENPTKIAQEYKGTCVATTATIVATRKNPAEYGRLIADLARPEGQVRLANGHTLTRSATWNDPKAEDGNRTPSVRLLQPALMEYGNGFRRYDNIRDIHTLDAQPPSLWERVKEGWDRLRRMVPLGGGLAAFGSNKILEGLTGEDYRSIFMVSRLNRGSAWRRIESAIAQGHSVPVGLAWEGGGHKILLDKIEGGFAYYTNPWGQKERMTVAEFRGNMIDANLPR